jgi:tyrosyl-tRNA synthetase
MIDGMNSISIVDILLSCKFASSKADAKRQIIAGSIRIDNEKCTNPKAMYDLKAGKEGGITTNGRQMKVSSGKKKHVVVVVEAL